METITSIKIALVVTLVLLAQQATQAAPSVKNNGAKVNCNNFMEKIDTCGLAASYSFIYDQYGYPTNEKKLKESCAISQEGFDCLKQYAKCFDPIVKQGLISFVKGRKSRVSSLCKDTNSKSAKYSLDAFKCMYDSKKELFAEGEKTLVRKLDAISSSPGLVFDQRLLLTCCTIFEYSKKFLNDLDPQCTRYRKDIESEIKSLIGEIVPLMCTKYQNDGPNLNKACYNLPKLIYPKQAKARSLTRTILEVVVLIEEKDKQP